MALLSKEAKGMKSKCDENFWSDHGEVRVHAFTTNDAYFLRNFTDPILPTAYATDGVTELLVSRESLQKSLFTFFFSQLQVVAHSFSTKIYP